MSGYPVVIVDNCGFPVTVADEGWNLTEVTETIGGFPVTICSAGGYPVTGISGSTAADLILDSLQPETDGMVLHFESDTALVRDSGTPANNYDGSFNTEIADFLTYTSPSAKNVLQADGTLKYAAHNLYLNSGIPATQNITVVSGHPYKLIVTGTTSITVSGAGTGTATAGSPVTFSAGTTTATLTLNSGTGTAQFFKTPASETYLETTGSARYALPIEYDSAGVSKGVLSEPAATNLATYSNDFTNAAWIKTNVTLTADDAVSPSGETNATKVTSSASGVQRLRFNEATAGVKTHSIFVKQGSGAAIQIYDGADAQYFANFDVATGSVGNTGSKVTTDSTYFGNGWWRFSITIDGTTTGAGMYVHIVDATNVVFGSGSTQADFHYFYGAQFETGSVPTSYIPTYGSTVTRAKDQLTLATSAFPYSDTAGSIITSVDWKILSSSNIAYSLNDGTTSNRFLLYGATNDTAINSGGGLVQLNTDVFNAGADSDIHGVSVGSGSVSATANGVAVVSGSTAMPIGVTTFSIGMSRSNVQQLNGHFKYIKYLPRAIEDAELITDTTA